MEKNDKDALECSLSYVSENMDNLELILGDLRAVNVIDKHMEEVINKTSSLSYANKKALVDCLQRKPGALKHFCAALNDRNQKHIVKFIVSKRQNSHGNEQLLDATADQNQAQGHDKQLAEEKKDWQEVIYTQAEYENFKKFPLPVPIKAHLTRNMIKLYDNLDEGLTQIILEMKASGALTRLHKDSINSKTTTIEKVGKLVEIMTASSVHTFVRFLEAVKASGDDQLSQIFLELRGQEYTLDEHTKLKL